MTSNSISHLTRPSTNTSDIEVDRTGIGKRPQGVSSPGAPAPQRAARRGRRLGILAGAVALLVMLTGCNLPLSAWVPDLNGDGNLDQVEVDTQTKIVAASLSRSLANQRRQIQMHPFLTCVRRHESDRGPYPHTRGYTAKNPRSTASGAYQFLNSSWRVLSARAGHPGYSRAAAAPWYVQDAVAHHAVTHGGKGHWNGTGC